MTDPHANIRRAAAIAREAGLHGAAAELEASLNCAYTTSSEMVGTIGLAVRVFLEKTQGRLAPEAAQLLDECLQDVANVWPRRLGIWLVAIACAFAR
ncbi:MAG TPA: hypothetical protein VEL51_02680 [Vicinamibacterales bacterium]|nr:hypothetical protein [Vicinamibacterales bacterium]